MATPSLDIVGLGLGGIENTTLLSNQLIANSDHLLVLSFEPATLDYCAALGRQFVDLRPLYTKDRPAFEVYRRLVDEIVQQLGATKTVLVVDGNPCLYNSIVRLVREQCAQLGVDVKVHPAVSSFDLLISFMDIVVENGLQIFDVGRMLRDGVTVNPTVACLLFQLAGGGSTLLAPVAAQTPDTFVPLRDYLLQFYLPVHPFYIARAARSRDENDFRLNTTVSGFIEHAAHIDYDCSAFLPACKSEGVR